MDTFYLMKNLNDSERNIFQFEYNKQKKNGLIAYLLLLFLGGLIGLHQFYLGNKFTGIIYALVTVLGAAIIVGPFITMFLCFIDLFRLAGGVEKANNELAKRLYDKIVDSRRVEEEEEEKPAAYYERSSRI